MDNEYLVIFLPDNGKSLSMEDKSRQEDLLDLITALFKLALQSHRSADYKAVLYDSSITVDTTLLDQHKLFLLVIFVPYLESVTGNRRNIRFSSFRHISPPESFVMLAN